MYTRHSTRTTAPRATRTAQDRTVQDRTLAKGPPKAPPKAPRGQPLPLSQAQHYGLSVPALDSFGRPQDFKRYVDPNSAEGQAQQARFLNELARHNARQRELFGGGDG